ncbi:DUF3054 domain-containing protein [Leifsonia poae]|uniref:DUF3054 domain-containing protein n=1 Tax=Leifsonia poae TaxID=110933 RepID=UPI003D670CA9
MKTWRAPLIAFAIDVVLVLVFVLVGRRSHAEAASIAGIFDTAWPFLVGLVLGWLVTFAWRRPTAVLWPGIPIWLMTVAAGMLLRVSAGQGTAASFIIVATIVLGVFLVGWRLIALPITRRRRVVRRAS